jgi:hypothetical protein
MVMVGLDNFIKFLLNFYILLYYNMQNLHIIFFLSILCILCIIVIVNNVVRKREHLDLIDTSDDNPLVKAIKNMGSGFDKLGDFVKMLEGGFQNTLKDIKKAFDPKEAVKGGCPDGWRDDGTVCWLDSYGRGGGYPWKFGDGFNLDNARRRCENDNPQGCDKYGEIIYPRCRSGYHSVECCLCEPDGGIKRIELDARLSCPYEKHTKRVGALCYIP